MEKLKKKSFRLKRLWQSKQALWMAGTLIAENKCQQFMLRRVFIIITLRTYWHITSPFGVKLVAVLGHIGSGWFQNKLSSRGEGNSCSSNRDSPAVICTYITRPDITVQKSITDSRFRQLFTQLQLLNKYILFSKVITSRTMSPRRQYGMQACPSAYTHTHTHTHTHTRRNSTAVTSISHFLQQLYVILRSTHHEPQALARASTQIRGLHSFVPLI